MKTTFSRIFFIITVALLSTLMVIGTAYQRLAGKFLDEQAIGQLETRHSDGRLLGIASIDSSGIVSKLEKLRLQDIIKKDVITSDRCC